MKNIYRKPTAYIVLNSERGKIKKEGKDVPLLTFIQHCPGGPSQCQRARKESKVPIGRKEKTVQISRQHDA